MPPRHAYWTILIDNAPTAFRAREKEELLPTFAQLRRTNKDVVLKWFGRGQLWETPEAAEAAGRRPAAPREKRDRDWRPGGTHEDPRDRFKKKGRKQRDDRASLHAMTPESSVKPLDPRAPEQPAPKTTLPSAPAWRDKPQGTPAPAGARPWKDKPRGPSSPGAQPWRNKPSGTTPAAQPWRDKPRGTPPAGAQPWRNKPSGTTPAGAQPWRDKPRGTPPAGAQPWRNKPSGTTPAGAQPWRDKPRGTPPAGAQPWRDKPRSPSPGGARPWRDRPDARQSGSPDRSSQQSQPPRGPSESRGPQAKDVKESTPRKSPPWRPRSTKPDSRGRR